jgi:hypothetical protein
VLVSLASYHADKVGRSVGLHAAAPEELLDSELALDAVLLELEENPRLELELEELDSELAEDAEEAVEELELFWFCVLLLLLDFNGEELELDALEAEDGELEELDSELALEAEDGELLELLESELALEGELLELDDLSGLLEELEAEENEELELDELEAPGPSLTTSYHSCRKLRILLLAKLVKRKR